MGILDSKIQKITLIGVIGLMALGYNNCAKVQFSESEESIVARLNTGATIFINRDAPYTNSKNVTLFIEHNSASIMYITNDPTCQSGGVWEPYSRSRSWILAQDNRESKVFGKFREKALDINAPESECYSDSIIHDDIPPALSVVQAAPAITNASSISIKLNATDSLSGIAQLQCQDGSGTLLSACDSTLSLSQASEGPGSVTVRAWDKAGNQSLPLVQTWMVDRTPPTVTISSSPSVVTNNTLSKFEFSGSDTLSTVLTYECRTDALSFSACQSPFSTNLTEGTHQFFVRSKDQAGNFSNEATYSWKIDLSAPTVELTEKPKSETNQTTAKFQFTGTDDGQPLSKFECQMDGGAFTICSSPVSKTGLSSGSHTFAVRGYDSVGNVSSPQSYSWTVDPTSPTVTLTSHPAVVTKEIFALFTFTSTDSQTGIASTECSLDSSSFSACSGGSIVYSNLAPGSHQFQVRTTDRAGNISAPTKYQWTVDLTVPTIEILSGPSQLSNQTSAQIILKATDNYPGANVIECRLDNQSYGVCSEIVNYPVVTEGPHTFYARVTDAAGNISKEIIYTWVADVTGPSIIFNKIPLSTIGVLDTAVIEFIVTDSGSSLDSVTCGLADISETACTATKTESLSDLAPGTYTYRVTAQDRSGNKSVNTITWTVENNIRPVSQDIMVNTNNKADILVVIDNSGSMNPEQLNMANRFSAFLDTLKKLDWQVGIITTDVSYDYDKRDGRFLAFNGLTNTYIINSGMDPVTANTAFSKTIQRPANEGSGYEQGIAATYRAIERSKDPSKTVNAPNVSFFRPGAALAVLVVSDANETPEYSTQTRNVPQNLFNLVQTSWPGKPFLFHSIVVKSGDSACLAVSGNEGYGTSYEQLSGLTGGIIGSVCADNYSTQLTSMGNAVVDLIKSVTLTCNPLDTNKDGKPDIVVHLADGSTPPSYVLDGLKLTFASPLPAGNNQLTYTCLK